MDALRISDDVLRWAAQQAGESVETLAESVVKRNKDRARFVSGELTFAQVVKLANRIRIPAGLLFLESPPNIDRPSIPDLRQTQNADPLSADFFELLEDVKRKQDWFKQYLIEQQADPNTIVASYKPGPLLDSKVVAGDMRDKLKITPASRAGCIGPEAWFSHLANKAEAVGILVMKSGIVRSNTKKPLSTSEFRGFALTDKFAPLVFVNGRDFETAWVFTLAHELAHIWLGIPGVSTVTMAQSGIESLCNRIAGEVLVPELELREKWHSQVDIQTLARFFRVSRIVVARRAFDLKLIDKSVYDSIANQSEKQKNKSSGGDPWATIPARNSRLFTRVLVGEAMSGQMLLREAASLLNVKPDTVVALSKEL